MGHPRDDIRILTITGMAAGFTVLFGAPLGSALFALEILHRRGLQYYEALLPGRHRLAVWLRRLRRPQRLGVGPVWHFPPVGDTARRRLRHGRRRSASLGAVGAALFTLPRGASGGVLGLVPRRPLRPRWPGPGPARLWSPVRADLRRAAARRPARLRLAAGALAVAVLAKLLGTTVTLASGWKGGFIIPLFFMGAASASSRTSRRRASTSRC